MICVVILDNQSVLKQKIQAIRMAFELRLHQEKSYRTDPPLLREVKRRTFWSLYTEDKITSANKGYPLLIHPDDVAVQLPDITDIDNPLDAVHEYFIELIYQAHTLAFVLPFCYSADRFEGATVEQFRSVEAKVLQLESRINHNLRLSSITKSHLAISIASIKLIFYSPFFRPKSLSETALFCKFIPEIDEFRRTLAHETMVTVLEHDSEELLFSGPSIWSMLHFSNLRCFLTALSIKYDCSESYDRSLESEAETVIERLSNLANVMTKEKRWSFMTMSGNLLLWSKRVVENKAGEPPWQQAHSTASEDVATPSSASKKRKVEEMVEDMPTQAARKCARSSMITHLHEQTPLQPHKYSDVSLASSSSSSPSYRPISSRQSSVTSIESPPLSSAAKTTQGDLHTYAELGGAYSMYNPKMLGALHQAPDYTDPTAATVAASSDSCSNSTCEGRYGNVYELPLRISKPFRDKNDPKGIQSVADVLGLTSKTSAGDESTWSIMLEPSESWSVASPPVTDEDGWGFGAGFPCSMVDQAPLRTEEETEEVREGRRQKHEGTNGDLVWNCVFGEPTPY